MERKRWRYRRITPDMIPIMIDMKESGASYETIASEFDVTASTIRYWLKPEYKQKQIDNAILWRISHPDYKHPIDPDYIMERYHSDEEFRLRFIRHVKNFAEREKLKKLEDSKKD